MTPYSLVGGISTFRSTVLPLVPVLIRQDLMLGGFVVYVKTEGFYHRTE
jgi:hypothetical protein